ncbi:MAG: hypothetical protein RIC19_20150 [Phaeodactylibacter sp.]|uniref:hypothetical protein n=1 Tax=Phaeodactylibacter sp. TaxID=1940289 RepID=UPI0032EC0D85
MKQQYHIYLFEPCPIIATGISTSLHEIACRAHSGSLLPAPEHHELALFSDIAIISLSPASFAPVISSAAQLHWQFELPIIWTSAVPLTAYPDHYMFHQGFPILYKPFTSYQLKKRLRLELAHL